MIHRIIWNRFISSIYKSRSDRQERWFQQGKATQGLYLLKEKIQLIKEVKHHFDEAFGKTGAHTDDKGSMGYSIISLLLGGGYQYASKNKDFFEKHFSKTINEIGGRGFIWRYVKLKIACVLIS